MILLADGQLEARRHSAQSGPLAALCDSLRVELQPLLDRELFVPEVKALLSRAGGRCERDGTQLSFDPWSPSEHRCPRCGIAHRGEVHDRAWVTYYHLWLVERAVHAALFAALRDDQQCGALASHILGTYADLYLRLPNRDNVLGPTRLFFSTYLESIWLLNVCVAADLMAASASRVPGAIIDRIVEPSRALIAEYDEGMSNRQVWNNAAMMAAARLTNDERSFARLVGGDSGLEAHLERALLADGTWYEGENYHLFALRGLWYSVTMCEAIGTPIAASLRSRFDHAFVTPYLTALPDFTMVSRKDSQYAVSLRQWRMAEFAELGFARTRDPVLAYALSRCYEPGHPDGDTGRARSTADVERNQQSVALTRANLGWRALLHALPELPESPVAPPRSALLEQQGIAVFRRSPDVYAALDYGQSGGGHGHPDRLNVLLAQDGTRWLDDLGTGSYVDSSLHWYRSTLAHNAPLLDGHSQDLRDGALLAHDERDGLGWVEAEFDVGQDTTLVRTLVVTPDYVIDELRCAAARPVRLEVPWHLDAHLPRLTFLARPLDGGDGLEDGFGFVRSARAAAVGAGECVQLTARHGEQELDVTLAADRDTTLYAVSAPGQPAVENRPFYIVRCQAPAGETVLRGVLAWRTGLSVTVDDAEIIVQREGERHVHRRTAEGWRVELFTGAARSSIDLTGRRPRPPRADAVRVRESQAPAVLHRSPRAFGELSFREAPPLNALEYELGELHYRRSEESWLSAGRPRATLAFFADATRLRIALLANAGEPRFASRETENPYDNEHADTMGAGVQLYLRTADGGGGWMLVPESGDATVRVRPISGWGDMSAPAAIWRPTPEGYEMRIDVALPNPERGEEVAIDVDVIVNETTRERVRRRGQLVLSGARGEFVYLRGDRHEPTRLIPLVVTR